MVKNNWFLHHFFFMITITNAMTKTGSRDLYLFFSGKGLISTPIMINCSEFTKLTMRFHLLSAAQIHGRRARCLMALIVATVMVAKWFWRIFEPPV